LAEGSPAQHRRSARLAQRRSDFGLVEQWSKEQRLGRPTAKLRIQPQVQGRGRHQDPGRAVEAQRKARVLQSKPRAVRPGAPCRDQRQFCPQGLLGAQNEQTGLSRQWASGAPQALVRVSVVRHLPRDPPIKASRIERLPFPSRMPNDSARESSGPSSGTLDKL
jgi:hypothetical protein